MLPPQASTIAPHVDALYIFMVALTVVIGLTISGCIVYFAVKYRRRSPDQIGAAIHGGLMLEVAWSVIPLVIVLGIFVWSSWIFVAIADVPEDALDVYVVGKQWMWKVQHPDGQREINEVHVPVNRNIKLTLASQDVIHDFFIPAFRVKTDVVPGRYTRLWFNATTPGRYRVFCAEYCGTQHSRMRAEVVVLSARDYQAWLARGAGGGTLASAGQQLFQDLACDSCHRLDAQGRGPMLVDLFGTSVLLSDGTRVTADEAYLREATLRPHTQIVAGFQPLMPSFQGVITEEQLLTIIEYIKTLRAGRGVQQPPLPPGTQIEDYTPSVPPGGPSPQEPRP